MASASLTGGISMKTTRKRPREESTAATMGRSPSCPRRAPRWRPAPPASPAPRRRRRARPGPARPWTSARPTRASLVWPARGPRPPHWAVTSAARAPQATRGTGSPARTSMNAPRGGATRSPPAPTRPGPSNAARAPWGSRGAAGPRGALQACPAASTMGAATPSSHAQWGCAGTARQGPLASGTSSVEMLMRAERRRAMRAFLARTSQRPRARRDLCAARAPQG
mmetsp:Transcript_279/g.614  ORF Transcript_279/g.614 Transcript_279/m.614 type:complete len:225 (-) Transcript_279:1949-2623(-)